MPSPLTPLQRHVCMSHIRSANTKPELKVRRALFSQGFRFRVNVKGLPGTPDIVLPKYRTAVFVNGCFWHGHEGCRYYTHPKTHPEFWEEKVRKNKERDALDAARLEALGWSVVTIWECELKKGVFESTVEKLSEALPRNKAKWEEYQQRRRSDREFARAEAHRQRLVREEMERELQEQFHIPQKIRKASLEDSDL